MFILAKKDRYANNIMVRLTIHPRSRFIQAISLSINEYVQEGGHAYSVVLVQVGMFD